MQEEPEGSRKRSQKDPGKGGSQEEPGGLMRSQEKPAGASRSQEQWQAMRYIVHQYQLLSCRVVDPNTSGSGSCVVVVVVLVSFWSSISRCIFHDCLGSSAHCNKLSPALRWTTRFFPANMLARNVETLKNMNGTTAKFAKWYVRVLDPKVITYKFQAKGETVQATKFECILVSKDASQYMLGIVPFDFKDRNAAQKAMDKFKDSSVWEIANPTFDAKAKPEYIGCPLKTVLMMGKPTVIKAVPITNKMELNHPSHGLKVHLDIKGIMTLLGKRVFRDCPDTSKLPTKTFDFSGKFISISEQKDIVKNGNSMKVAAAEFVDASGGKIVVSVWNEAFKRLKPIPVGAGVAILGCSATKENADVKLNIWPGAHVSTAGEQAQSLTSLDTNGLAMDTLTATFTPGQGLALLVEGEACPTCAKALSDAVGQADAKVFQINRVMMDPPLQEELIFSQDGRPFIKNCRLRDRTGGADVDVVGEAVPLLYGCANDKELKGHLTALSLTSCKMRLNVRGVVRVEAGVTKKYVVKIEQSPLDAVISMSSMQQTLGLSVVSDDVVVAAPAERLLDDTMLGLALQRDSDEPLGAARVWLLVQGTEETELQTIDEKVPLSQQIFKLVSNKATCLLSKSSTVVKLVGYSDFKKSLAYRLDTEVALVLVSAVERDGPASVTVTVEHMKKVSNDEKSALQRSMTLEWESVLCPWRNLEPKRVASTNAEYWELPAPKLRRLVSEPVSPKKLSCK